MLTGVKCRATGPEYLGPVLIDPCPCDSPVAGPSVPHAAGLRDWFRRAALCQAPSHAAGRLRGVNVALLHPPGAGGRKTLLHKAIDDLGANAVSIEFAHDDQRGTRGVAAMARVLGRLYDAVDCANLERATVQSIAQEAGVPVFCDLGGEQHPVKAYGELWTIEKAVDDAGRRIRFIGNTQAEPARTFVAAADRLGFGIEADGQGTQASAVPFTVDASDPCRWTLRKGSTPVGEALRLNNRTCLIQALLLREILGR